ncbi:hypothetical protein [Streptomyces laurentii]|uniref:hypothetical protein n=1 Tax=Streptomyces laurentii TaxID=39478 RepID=UPI0026D1D78D
MATGTPVPVATGSYGDQHTTATLAPGHPVHFDIQVPGEARQLPADEASFTLQAPGGQVPGTSFADGRLRVAAGTLIGPVRQG